MGSGLALLPIHALRCRALALLFFLLAGTASAAPITATDGTGQNVHLHAPAQRIIALAPHAAELLFDVGAGARLVGTVAYSDYPEAAKTVPQVGGYQSPDLERILALHPDLIVAWLEGNGPALIERLHILGLSVYVSNPQTLDDIGTDLAALGRLTGSAQGATAAATYRQRLNELRARYARQSPVRVFYEVWNQPLMTATDRSLIGQVITLCGGRNVFAHLPGSTPTVTTEAVLGADPGAIVASGMAEARPQWLDDWRRWPELAAVRGDHLYFIPPSLLQRPTPRLLDGAQALCRDLAAVRTAAATK